MVKIPVTTIDTGVPIPDSVVNYPLKDLDVGDSFVFPKEKRASVQSKASLVKKETGREFTVSKIDDTNCRIWRVK